MDGGNGWGEWMGGSGGGAGRGSFKYWGEKKFFLIFFVVGRSQRSKNAISSH